MILFNDWMMRKKIYKEKKIDIELKHYLFPRISLFIFFVGVIVLFDAIQKEHWVITNIIGIFIMFFILLNFIVYKIYPQFILMNSIIIYAVILIGLNIFYYNLGGFISDAVVFFYVCIILGFTLFGVKIGIILSLINISIVIIYYILLKLDFVFPTLSDNKFLYDYRLIDFLAVSIIIMFIIWQYELRSRNTTSELLKANEQLSHDAFHDRLTKLPNRNFLLKQLEGVLTTCNRRKFEQVKRDGSLKFALLFIDLDNFKKINDNYGHHIGDEVLKIVSGRLLKLVRLDDFVARLGGDEFIVILNDISQYDDITIIVSKMVEALKKSIKIDILEIKISASIGVTTNSNQFESPEEMIQYADNAMYQAKSKGKSQFIINNDDID
jgi:diguanylate cyclase (GGDEF)-like protein